MQNLRNDWSVPLFMLLLAGPVACNSTAGTPDSGTPSVDAGSRPDAGSTIDAGSTVDAGSNEADAGGIASVIPTANAGSLTTVALQLDNPSDIALEGSTVFWTDTDAPGAVTSAAVTGGAVSTLAPNQSSPFAIVSDSTSVYWVDLGTTDSNGNPNSDGVVFQSSLTGANVVTLASRQAFPNALALAGHDVYWVNAGSYTSAGAYNNDGAVLSVPIGGGAVTTLAKGQNNPYDLAVDSKNVYWVNSGSFDASSGAYNNDGSVLQQSLTAGSSPVTLASSVQNFPFGIAVDSTNVYWVGNSSFDSMGDNVDSTGTITQVPIGGTGDPTTLATGQASPQFTYATGSALYWVNQGTAANGESDGSIVKLAIPAASGATPTSLVSSIQTPVALVLDSSGGFYFTENGTQSDDGAVFGFSP